MIAVMDAPPESDTAATANAPSPRGDPERAGRLDRFREYRKTGDRTIRNALVVESHDLARRAARRFARRGEPQDDLVQVAQLGLVKAVERFDPELGVPFEAFALPTMLGELRRHFRDTTWSIRVPRRVQERYLSLRPARDVLAQRLGRPPSAAELAEYLGASIDEVLEALEASSAYRSASFDPAVDEHAVRRGPDDGDLAASVATTVTVRTLLERLPVRERTIVYLRYFGGLTQEEIAAEVGVSQMHVSRLLRRSLEQLRDHLGDDPGLLD